ncbi:WD40 repeat-like protein [Annulohypoxylon maeteangense]|uniref:WD40 repeat-like protein n=1 Tax=Annulohypoxylon maeteangense TaxID=1927788 RepID=UPI0020087EB3|nr:WD40 repeat-like protein [Annulohypoxylon maeteangense]KAI0884701.1 WD40 repeat-like protein [Annulohypoxylon maeteangense]
MHKGTSPDQFFQTDAEQAKRERREAKAGNKNGNPVVLKSKLLAAIPDPTSPSSVLIAESAGSVRRVNVDTSDTKQVFRGPSAPVTCISVGGSGNKTLFAGSWDKDVWSWDLSSRTPGRKYSGHTDFVKAVVSTKLGGKDVLISGGADKKIIVWDVETGSRLHLLQDLAVSMMAVQDLVIDPVQFSPDEVILVSASSDPHIRRWRIRLDGFEQIKETSPDEPGAIRHAILEHDTTVYKLVFDSEGEEVDLWTSSGDGTAKCLSRIKGFATDDSINHGDHVRAVAVTDQWIITAGRDEDVKVWNRASGKLYSTLEGHYDEVTDLVILEGGRRIVSVSIDGTVRTWSLDQVELDKINKEKEDKAKGIVKETPAKQEKGLMTVEEEAELAALMEDDD